MASQGRSGPPGRAFGSALTGISAALVVGLVQVSLAVSFAALVFSGPLEPYLGIGIGLALFATVVSGLIVAATATVPGTVGNLKGVTTALIAVMAADIARSLGPDVAPETMIATVVAAVALTSLSTGLILVTLGRFRLGNVVRLLPYPVIGGFIAGTGWILASSSLEVLAGAPLVPAQLGAWLDPTTFPKWSLALAFALTILLVTGRSKWAFVVPGMLLATLGLFFGWVALSDANIAQLRIDGWTLRALPAGVLWQPGTWWFPDSVAWSAVASQVPAMGVIALIAAMEALLNATGLEVILRRDVDLDRELRSAGMSNVGTSLGGGLVGYQALSLTVLGHRMGGTRRWSPLVAAGVGMAALLGGAGILSTLPTFMLSGLMAYLGLNFLKTWLVDVWGSIPVVEYLVIVAIVVTIGVAGILPGVGVGVLASIVLFAVAYGRVNVVRHELPGWSHPSRVTRSQGERAYLAEHRDAVTVVHLQGYLFFGTSRRVTATLRRRIDAGDAAPRFLLVDFRRVTGIDTTAAHALLATVRAAEDHGVELAFTHLRPGVQARLLSLAKDRELDVRAFSDLDRGLEWCEQTLLETHEDVDEDEDPLAAFGLDPRARSRLIPYLERRTLAAGDLLVREGDPSDELFLVAGGALTAQLERPDAGPLRLETVGAGHVLGELGFLLQKPLSASVIADVNSDVWTLTRTALERLTDEDPETALAWQTAMSERLSVRVTHLMGVVRALER